MIRLCLLLILLLLIPIGTKSSIKKKVHTTKYVKVSYDIAPLVDREIYSIARSYGYSDITSKLIVAQARHETASYTSKLYREANNAFGMMKHKKDTLALKMTFWAEGRDGYAGYKNIAHSTIAALGWLARRKCPTHFDNEIQYSRWLKSKSYYEAEVSEYLPGLRRHLKEINIQSDSVLWQSLKY